MGVRTPLLWTCLLIVGASAALVFTGNVQVDDSAVPDLGGVAESIDTDPPATNESIKTTTSGVSLVRKVTLYESGAAEITLAEDHGCFDQIEIKHADSNTVYKTVPAPEFSGPVVVDMKQIVQNNGPYPNNRFEIRLSDRSNDGCMAVGATDRLTVTVPRSWTNN